MAARTDEDIVTNPHWVECHLASTQSHRRSNRAISRDHTSANILSVSRTASVSSTTYRPILIAVVTVSFSPSAGLSGRRKRSPLRHTPAMTTDLPPSMMFCLPSITARREILLPVSCLGVRRDHILFIYLFVRVRKLCPSQTTNTVLPNVDDNERE